VGEVSTVRGSRRRHGIPRPRGFILNHKRDASAAGSSVSDVLRYLWRMHTLCGEYNPTKGSIAQCQKC
jgi:hypothetical protein